MRIRFTRKPGLSFTITGSLPICCANRSGTLQNLRRGLARGDDLDELHPVNRIEKMQADDTFRMSRAGGQFRNRQRRRVRGENRVLAGPVRPAAGKFFSSIPVFPPPLR